jgi:uncharacterized protein YecE (DUF72 family)
MEHLHIGTTGWQYPDWKETFYPKDMNPGDYLEHYSTEFNAVEINSTYYQLPKSEAVAGWYRNTPKNFLFCPRLIRALTENHELNTNENLLKAFLGHFITLELSLGPIIVEIPPSISLEHPHVLPFLDMLGGFSHSYTFVIEARHLSWANPKAAEMCETRGLAWSISDFCGQFPTIQKTLSNNAYLRFHGTNNIDQSNYSHETLGHCAEKAKQWLSENKQVFVFFNNHFGGHALENAREFQSLMFE